MCSSSPLKTQTLQSFQDHRGVSLGYEGASLVAQMVKNPPEMRETWVGSLGWDDPPGGGHGNSLHSSCLENPVDGGAWWATVHEATKSWTCLSD